MPKTGNPENGPQSYLKSRAGPDGTWGEVQSGYESNGVWAYPMACFGHHGEIFIITTPNNVSSKNVEAPSKQREYICFFVSKDEWFFTDVYDRIYL